MQKLTPMQKVGRDKARKWLGGNDRIDAGELQRRLRSFLLVVEADQLSLDIVSSSHGGRVVARLVPAGAPEAGVR